MLKIIQTEDNLLEWCWLVYLENGNKRTENVIRLWLASVK